jgi:hypothetical protein
MSNKRDKIHFAIRPEPIPHHGWPQMTLCKQVIQRAQPVVIVPDAVILSVGMLADTFGSKFCKACKLAEPGEGYVYMLAEEEFIQGMRRRPYEEAI